MGSHAITYAVVALAVAVVCLIAGFSWGRSNVRAQIENAVEKEHVALDAREFAMRTQLEDAIAELAKLRPSAEELVRVQKRLEREQSKYQQMKAEFNAATGISSSSEENSELEAPPVLPDASADEAIQKLLQSLEAFNAPGAETPAPLPEPKTIAPVAPAVPAPAVPAQAVPAPLVPAPVVPAAAVPKPQPPVRPALIPETPRPAEPPKAAIRPPQPAPPAPASAQPPVRPVPTEPRKAEPLKTDPPKPAQNVISKPAPPIAAPPIVPSKPAPAANNVPARPAPATPARPALTPPARPGQQVDEWQEFARQLEALTGKKK
jgi:hypothetical protein